MHYNFDEIIDRSGNNSVKYDRRAAVFGREDVIPMWVADMDFRVAKPITDALEAKVKQGIFGYTSRPDSYFQAMCQFQERRKGWRCRPDLISFCVGVVPALAAIVHQFSEPGEKILIQTPVYAQFAHITTAWNRSLLTNRLVEANGVYEIDFAAFEQSLRQRPKLFILCSPHNPVGRVWRRDELARMAELCGKYGVRIVSDEIHSDLILWGNRHTVTATLAEADAAQTITCVSGTKTFNLAGLQAGAVVFPNQADKERFDRYWDDLDLYSNNSFSVEAMEAAFRHGDEWLEQLLPYIEGNITFAREYCAEHIPLIRPNRPEATYLLWLDCRELGLTDDELADFFVKQAGLGLNRGISFGAGGEGFMRMNLACPRSILALALVRLREAVGERNK